jgi:hypothetical protein
MNEIHGHRTGNNKKRSPTYLSWVAMKQRCFNENHIAYNNYGGRGISVCDRWLVFSNFLEDMGPRPKNKTLDRRDTNGPYCKDNCKWSTRSQQNRNRRIASGWLVSRTGKNAITHRRYENDNI